MKIEQMYTECLAEAAYFIVSGNEAAVVDPLREPGPYLEMAEKYGVTIKYNFETHFHADFVSGHLDLAEATGATIVYGPGAKMEFDAHVAEDGETFAIGDIRIRALHTPGHTLESTTWLLVDGEGKDHAIFTGDTLFIGDVGRPDLAVKSDLSKEDLAALLYDSLHNKLLPLDDAVIVYPGHGAGSACGKNIGTERYDTLGNQKRTNFALAPDLSKADFIAEVTTGLMTPPWYFPWNAMLNKQGYESFDELMKRNMRPLSAGDFQAATREPGILVLDTRSPEAFAAGHIPGSLFIGLDGSFAPWVGTLVCDIDQLMLLITEPGRENEAVTRLARVGYENVKGFLDGGFDAWKHAELPVADVASIPVREFAASAGDLAVIDVRRPGEFTSRHLIGAANIPLDYLQDRISELPEGKTVALHCKSGYRSMIAASMLLRSGKRNFLNVEGGFDAILESEMPVSGYVCPTTM